MRRVAIIGAYGNALRSTLESIPDCEVVVLDESIQADFINKYKAPEISPFDSELILYHCKPLIQDIPFRRPSHKRDYRFHK